MFGKSQYKKNKRFNIFEMWVSIFEFMHKFDSDNMSEKRDIIICSCRLILSLNGEYLKEKILLLLIILLMEATELQYADEYTLHLLLGEGGQARFVCCYLVSILGVRIINYMHLKFTSPDSPRSMPFILRLIYSRNSTISIWSIWWIVENKQKSNWQIRHKRSGLWSFWSWLKEESFSNFYPNWADSLLKYAELTLNNSSQP